MDSSTTTALIAAGAAVAGSGVVSIGAVWAARSNARQAEAKIAADHAAWLREKRAEVYVQLNAFVWEAAWTRAGVIKDGAASSDLRDKVAQFMSQYSVEKIKEVGARGTTFTGPEIAYALNDAAMANLQAWLLFLEAVGQALDANTPGHYVTLTGDIYQALKRADLADSKLSGLIGLDVSWTEYNRKHFRIRRRAQRLQLKHERELDRQRVKFWGEQSISKGWPPDNNQDPNIDEPTQERRLSALSTVSHRLLRWIVR